MAIGRKLSLTPNVKSKKINVTATANQTLFTVTGGYRVNNIGVYRNGALLAVGSDFLANDGSTVTLLTAATAGDIVQFEVFDTHELTDSINANGDQVLNGALTVTGIVSASSINIGSAITFVTGEGINVTGVVTATSVEVGNNIKIGNAGVITATSFSGSGANLTGIDATAIKDSGGNVKIQAQASGAVYTGIHTFTTLKSTSADFTGNVSIGGTLTYEDVTNIDSVGLITAREGIFLPDSKRLHIGNTAGTGDLQLYHSGTNSVIDNNTGDLVFRNNVASDVGGNIIIQAKSGEESAKFTHDGSVELRYDNVKKFETTSSGIAVTGGVEPTGHVKLDDDRFIYFGTGDDLKIYHHASSFSFIENNTGILHLRSVDGIKLQD